MSGPWERFQEKPEEGPWTKFAPAQAEKHGMAEDAAKSVVGAPIRAATGLVGFPQTILELIGKGVEKTGLVSPGATTPTFSNIGQLAREGYDKLFQVFTGAPMYEPQTGAGRMTDMVAQTLFAPGQMTAKLAAGVGAGAAGEGARLSGVNNPLALGVLQMMGAGAASLPLVMRSVPASNIEEAIKHITPQHLNQAQRLMDDAARMGSPLTGAEAIAQVTGKNTLQDIQRVVEASSRGGPVLQTMMNQRPGASRAAFESQADSIAPMPIDPSRTPVRMQQAAEGAITSARQAGNEQARPFYDAARSTTLSPAQASSTVFEPALNAAINRVVRDPMSSAYRMPPSSVAAIDAAKKYLDDVAGSAKIAGRNELAKNASSGATAAREVADAASPEYRQARAIVAENRQNVVNPMRESPVGDIARTINKPAEQAMRAQGEILMPQAPRALNPATIRKTVSTIKSQDPDAARDFVRQNLQAIFDESAQNLSGGANQWGGAKFAAQIVGNPRQKENLQALVESVSDKQAWVGFNRMLQVLEAQGKRHAPGSQTAFNQKTQARLSAGGLGAIPASAASPNKALSIVGEAYDSFRFGKNTEDMARILTDPKSVDLMRKLALEAPTSGKAASITAQIIAFQAGVNDE
jgi:hypothetical protein